MESIGNLESNQKKEYVQNKIQGNLNWVNTLTKKVDEGITTRENANKMIANVITAMEVKKELAEDKARRDALTGLYNKGAFNSEYQKAIESGTSFALIMIDIDHFGKVNKAFGHDTGDNVLVQTALNFSSNLRQLRERDKNDFIARWGGEEFAIILMDVFREEDLELVSEKLRKAVCERPFSVKVGEEIIDIPITISIGAGIYKNGDKDLFFHKVDKDALLLAKETGRNKTVITSK